MSADRRRQQILEFLARHPISRLASISSATGIGRSPLVHHLRVLQDSGLVRASRYAGAWLFLPAGQPETIGTHMAPPKLRRAELVKIALETEPFAKPRDLAAKLGISQSWFSRLRRRVRLDLPLERNATRAFGATTMSV